MLYHLGQFCIVRDNFWYPWGQFLSRGKTAPTNVGQQKCLGKFCRHHRGTKKSRQILPMTYHNVVTLGLPLSSRQPPETTSRGPPPQDTRVGDPPSRKREKPKPRKDNTSSRRRTPPPRWNAPHNPNTSARTHQGTTQDHMMSFRPHLPCSNIIPC